MEQTISNTFTVDVDSLKRCFEVIKLKNQQNQQLVSEAQKYIDDCKKDPQFPGILLQLFDNPDEDFNIRLLSIIEFKNLIKECWSVRKASKTMSVYPDQMKKEIRTTLLSYLDKYQEKAFRTQLNDILKIISSTDFPMNFPDLVQYFLNNMQGLTEAIKDEQALLSDITLNFVKTLKIIMTERCKKRIGDYRNLFYNVYLKLMEGFHGFWDYFHVNMLNVISVVGQGNFELFQKFIYLSRKADFIYISFLCNGCEDMVENPDIVKIVALVVQRAAELTELTKNIKENKNMGDLYRQVSKNLYKYLYSLSELQAIFPLAFREVLTNYIKLIEFIIDNPESFSNEYVLRAAIICLNSALRRYSYQGKDIVVNKKPSQFGNYEEISKQCIMEFHQYFTQEKIEAFFNIFLLKLLPRRPILLNNQDPENLDDFVEIENDQYSEFEKLETPLYNLTLKCTSEFLLRFPEQGITLIHGLANKIIQNELSNLAPIIQDGIFAMIGQLPIVYEQLKVDPSNYLNLADVLKYLEERALSDLNLSKRIPVLIHKWIGLFSPQIKAQVIQNIVQIIQNLQNYVVRYECCMCLKAILRTTQFLDLNYAALSEHLVPVIIDLLGRFRNPQATWGLIEILRSLFTKAQYSIQNDNIIAQLQSHNIQVLTKVDDQLLLPALSEMFKTIIASFPFGTVLTSIFTICIEYIDYHFKDNKFRSPLLSLWLFLVREYSENQNVDDAMKALFSRYSGPLLTISNPDELSKFINIIEEYILAGLIFPEDYLNIIKIMEEKFEKTLKVSVPSESIFNLKSALLSLMSTLILIIMRQGNLDNLRIFDKMLMFLLKDLLNDFFDLEFKSLKASKVSMITLINRLIILNLEGFLDMLNKFQIGLNNFLAYWTSNMAFLISTQTRRINSIAVFRLLPCIKDKELLATHLEDFLKYVMPELKYAVENGNKPPVVNDQKIVSVQERCEDVRDSERKKEIRQIGLYYDVDLKDLFIKSFKELVTENNLSRDELAYCIKDQETTEWVLQLLST